MNLPPWTFVPLTFYCLINPIEYFIKSSKQGTVSFMSIDCTMYQYPVLTETSERFSKANNNSL